MFWLPTVPYCVANRKKFALWVEIPFSPLIVWKNIVPFARLQLFPCYQIFPKKLIFIQLIQKFPSFYGTRNFTVVFPKSCHWIFLESLEYNPPYVSKICFNISLLYTPVSLKCQLCLGLPTKMLCSVHLACYTSNRSQPSWLNQV